MEVEGEGKFAFLVGILVLFVIFASVESNCDETCEALASYYIRSGTTLTFISNVFSSTISQIRSYNPHITNPDLIIAGSRINVPFPCSCIQGTFLGHQFAYEVRRNDTYKKIAETYYANLTTIDRLRGFHENQLQEGARLNVTVNCSCGDSGVSKDYKLFVTYPVRIGESLSTIADGTGLSEELLKGFNPGSDFSTGSLVFVPG